MNYTQQIMYVNLHIDYFYIFYLSGVVRSMGSKKHEWMSQMNAIQRDLIESFFFLLNSHSLATR